MVNPRRESWRLAAVMAAAVSVAPLAAVFPAHAQFVAPQPLTPNAPGAAAPEPARPTPLQAPRQPLPPPRGELPLVEQLTEVDPSVTGLLDDSNGGLGVDMWNGTSRTRVETLLPRVPAASVSAVMQDLLRRLLLTTASLPVGQGVAPSLLGLRVERLMASGRIADVNELLRLAATPVHDPALSRAEIDALLLAGDFSTACQKVPALAAADPRGYLLKTLAFCRALDRDQPAVSLATALLRDQGQQGDEAFFTLIAALPGGAGAPPVATLVDPTPLHLAMLRAANQRVPADAIGGAQPAILWAIATAPRPDPTDISPEVLQAAERAEAAGALSTDVLAAIFSTVAYTQEQIDAALDTAGRERGPRVNALLFQAATVWTEPAKRAAALSAAFKSAREDGLLATAGRLNRANLRAVQPTSALLPFAPDAVRASLAAGDLETAWRWADLVLREAGSITPTGPNTAAIQSAARLWPLLQLVDPEGARTRAADRTRTWWRDLPTVPEGAAADSRALLYVLFEALDEPLPNEAWEPLIAGPLTIAARMPAASLSRMLSDAASADRIGETVLLSLLALGELGPEGSDATTLTQVIRALRAIGFEREARAVAAEAALGHGI